MTRSGAGSGHVVRLRLVAHGARHGRLAWRARHRGAAGSSMRRRPAWHFALLACRLTPLGDLGRGLCSDVHRQEGPADRAWWTKCWGSGSRLRAPLALNWPACWRAFVLFRLFDIWKPSAGATARVAARRRGHRGRRSDGGHLRARLSYSLQDASISIEYVPCRKRPRASPRSASVSPHAAIAGGEFQIRGRASPRRRPASR